MSKERERGMKRYEEMKEEERWGKGRDEEGKGERQE